MIRIIFIPVYAYLYLNAETMADFYIATAIMGISMITDLFDGYIARKYNMITEFGKLIDPIADKLTQGVLLWCLVGKYPLAKALLLLFIVKESYMCMEGMKTVAAEGRNE